MDRKAKADGQLAIRDARKDLNLLAFAVSHGDDEKAAERMEALESQVGRVRKALRTAR